LLTILELPAVPLLKLTVVLLIIILMLPPKLEIPEPVKKNIDDEPLEKVKV
jgi:hypothetical protein